MFAPKVTRPIVSNSNKSGLEEQSEELKNSDKDEEFRRMIIAKFQQLTQETQIYPNNTKRRTRESQCKV